MAIPWDPRDSLGFPQTKPCVVYELIVFFANSPMVEHEPCAGCAFHKFLTCLCQLCQLSFGLP
jgi:hypothetical protein